MKTTRTDRICDAIIYTVCAGLLVWVVLQAVTQ